MPDSFIVGAILLVVLITVISAVIAAWPRGDDSATVEAPPDYPTQLAWIGQEVDETVFPHGGNRPA